MLFLLVNNVSKPKPYAPLITFNWSLDNPKNVLDDMKYDISFTSKVSNKHFKENSTFVSRYRSKMHSPGNWPSPSGTVSSSSSCQKTNRENYITLQGCYTCVTGLPNLHLYFFPSGGKPAPCRWSLMRSKQLSLLLLTRYWLTFVFPFSFDGRDLVLFGLKMPHNSIILAPSLPDYYDKTTYLFYQHTDKKYK